MKIHVVGRRRRALVRSVVSGVCLTATLGFAAGPASAAYKAQVQAGTLQIVGDGASDKLELLPTPTTLELDVGEDGTIDFAFDRSTFSAVNVQAGGGNDDVRVGPTASPLSNLTIDGGAGDDTLIGGDGDDTLIGGAGNDFVDGGRGSDTALLGAGKDTFVWNPGEGSDTVDGQGGNDTLDFNGSNAAENIDVSANGSRVRLFRDVANITMDLNGIEALDLNTLGSADHVTVGDLTGTDLKDADIDLSSSTGPGTGDGAADTVTVDGTDGADNVKVGSAGGNVLVSGLSTDVQVAGAESTLDNVDVNTLGGDDTIIGQNGIAGLTDLTIDGGAGDDTITGGDGDDTLIGGAGSDSVSGGRGSDVALLGGGDDTFTWNPGDGNDTVEGQGGSDDLDFNGSNAAEKIDLSANGSRVRLFRDVANITMDLNGIEGLNLETLGSADTVTVNDLTGTDLKTANIDLSSSTGPGTGDGSADTVIVNGTAGPDRVRVVRTGAQVQMTGLVPRLSISGSEPANDTLQINTLAGADTVNVAADVSQLISPLVDLGADQ